MSHPKEWNEEEDNFDLTLSQRTEELYRIPDGEPDEEGLIDLAVLVLRDIVVFPHMISPIFITPGPNPIPTAGHLVNQPPGSSDGSRRFRPIRKRTERP